MLFMIPGVDETLRINGTARLSTRHVETFATEKCTPRIVIQVTVEQAYLQCAKARCGHSSGRPKRASSDPCPTLGEMPCDHAGMSGRAESQAEMLARYEREL
jgi:predicted pyridoxine 5'-phosphate oxidase superfamily flavin-nucleotide-binding protein